MAKYTKQIFILLIIILLSQTVYSQKNQTSNITKFLNKTIETKQDYNQKTTFLTPEQLFSESQRNFDRSLTILNVIVTGIGALIAIIAILVAIAIGFGFFQYKRWSKIRKDAEKNLKYIQEIKNRAEKEATEIVKNLKERQIQDISKEDITHLSNRLKDLEILGAQSPDEYFIKGVQFSKNKEFESAIKLYNQAIELNHKDPSSWNNKGLALSELGKYEEALKSLDKAIELKPDDPISWNNKGSILQRLGKYEEALKSLDKAIELKPDYPAPWGNKGIALSKLGKYEEALKSLNKAIEIDPKNDTLWFNYACFYSLKKEKGSSLKYLKKAIGFDHSNKELAKKDEDFKFLWDDKDFKELVK